MLGYEYIDEQTKRSDSLCLKKQYEPEMCKQRLEIQDLSLLPRTGNKKEWSWHPSTQKYRGEITR